jgi:hypothetical protein
MELYFLFPLPPAGGSGAAFCGYTEYPQIYERQYGIM